MKEIEYDDISSLQVLYFIKRNNFLHENLTIMEQGRRNEV